LTKRIDVALGEILGKDPKIIRFYGYNMILELDRGRQLTPAERRKLFNNSRVNLLKEA